MHEITQTLYTDTADGESIAGTVPWASESLGMHMGHPLCLWSRFSGVVKVLYGYVVVRTAVLLISGICRGIAHTAVCMA